MIIPSSSFLIFFLYSLLSTISSAEIKIGSTLLPTTLNPWKSPKNSFSLSFIPIDSSFSLAIAFSNIPIWKAGGDFAIVDSNSRFEFLPSGNLRLINGSDVVIWQSNTSNLGVTVANLDDSGNLALKNGSTTVWSTFDNPTDTILPTQNFTTSKTLKSGVYSFNLLSSGNLTLKWNENTTYWNLGLNSTINSNLSSPNLTLSPTGVLQLNDFNLSNPVNLAFSSDYGEGNDTFRFLKLDSDGNLRIYSFDNGNLFERWAAVQDQCLVYGWCGNMGICSYNESKPICICPSRNFDYFDQNDSRKGCKRKVEIENCPTEKVMLELDNTKFLTYQPELTSQSITGTASGILACKTNCLPDDTCTASTSLADGTGLCYMKRSKIISGYHSPALRSTSYIKVCGPIILNPPLFDPNMVPSGKRFTLHRWVIVYVVLITLLCLVFMGGVIWLWYYRNDRNYVGLSRQYALVEYASVAPIQFTYKELERSTKGFTEKIGSGGFGSVYRGVLPNRTVVAVKQLEGIEQGEKQFRMEVSIISSTHHLNLMRLIGFCSLGRHRLVVYEFMKNGSLDNFIFTAEESSRKLLNWETRFRVALGTAKGITYLHEECRECIIHCDIKPENILLDENYNARVSDFGLSKLINPKHLHHWHKTLTSLRGTRGYLAPEWVANLAITPKSDVYSYGMVLLEMVMGRRNFEVSEETSWKKSSVWAYEEFESGNLHNIVDKRLAKQETDMEQVLRAIQTSFWCIQEQPIHRPKMGKVVQMLEGITPIERPPVPNGSTEGFVNRNGGTNVSEVVTTIASSDLSLSSSSVQASRGSSSFPSETRFEL